jgi:hypothetical protein
MTGTSRSKSHTRAESSPTPLVPAALLTLIDGWQSQAIGIFDRDLR